MSELFLLLSSKEHAWIRARDMNGSFKKLTACIPCIFWKYSITLNWLNPYCKMHKICPTELSLGDVEASVWSFSCSQNVCNQETFDTTKPMKPWDYETREKTTKPKVDTYKTTKPIKPMCDETRHNSESSLTETNEHKETWENTFQNNTLTIY